MTFIFDKPYIERQGVMGKIIRSGGEVAVAIVQIMWYMAMSAAVSAKAYVVSGCGRHVYINGEEYGC